MRMLGSRRDGKGSVAMSGEEFPDNRDDFASSCNAERKGSAGCAIVVRAAPRAPGEAPRSRMLERWRADVRTGEDRGRRYG